MSVFKIIFSGQQAIKYDKEILYITERAIFRLTKEGLVLEEIAPGIDIEKNIKAKMDFAPIVSSSIKEMDERLFKVGKVGMREEIINVMRK